MTDRNADELPAMDVAEIDDVLFVFKANPGETIAGVAITVEVVGGRGRPDAGAQSMAQGQHQIGSLDADGAFVPAADGLVVLQRFDARGRTVRNVYCWRCVVTLSSGRQLTAAGHVAVRKL